MKRLQEVSGLLQQVYLGIQLLIRGSGLLIFKLFLASNRKKVDVDSPYILLSGLLFWLVLFSAAVLLLS